MTQALNYMIKLIADGYDYSDAQYKAATKFEISADSLAEAYDNN